MELDETGGLVTRQMFPAVAVELGAQLVGGLGARRQLHRGRDALTHLLVRDPEHGDVGHSRVVVEDLLDLGGVDVDAT